MGIIAGFGTPEPVEFREKGCDTVFAARISGALYIDDYDEAKYGATNEERKASLARFAVEKVTEHLYRWNKDDKLLGIDGENQLELMLNYDLMEAGMQGSSRVKDISITDETNDLYQEQIIKPYREAKSAQRELEIEAADEPHGPLKRISYNLSSHGMMAGTSSGNGRAVEWKDDGTVIYSYSSYGPGTNSDREYKVAPETAKKIADFVTQKRLAALSKMDIPTVTMYDCFTSANINMEFDDSSIGGDPHNSYHLNCGPSGYTFKSIENELTELLKECEETGECIKNEVHESANPFGNFIGMMGMASVPDNSAPDFNGMKQAEETPKPVVPWKWTCKCGSENTGQFCPECGGPRPEGWICSCGSVNTRKFCSNCGQPAP